MRCALGNGIIVTLLHLEFIKRARKSHVSFGVPVS